MWCEFQDGTWAAEEAEKLCDALLAPLHAHFLRISKPQVLMIRWTGLAPSEVSPFRCLIRTNTPCVTTDCLPWGLGIIH